MQLLFFNTLPVLVYVLHLFKALRRFNYLLLGVSQLKNENVIVHTAAPGERILFPHVSKLV